MEWFTQTWLKLQQQYRLMCIQPTSTAYMSSTTRLFKGNRRGRHRKNTTPRFLPRKSTVLSSSSSLLLSSSSSTSLESSSSPSLLQSIGMTLKDMFQLILQRMQDPEEIMDSILRQIVGDGRYARYYQSTPRRIIRSTYHSGGNTSRSRRSLSSSSAVDVDTLLYPSTWTPLRLLLSVAVSFAIVRTLGGVGVVGGNESISTTTTHAAEMNMIRNWIMRSFVIQEVIHSEWIRVFAGERRIALGSVLSGVDIIAYLSMVVPIVTVTGPIGTLLLIPPLIARLVSSWMNFLLYHDRYWGDIPGGTFGVSGTTYRPSLSTTLKTISERDFYRRWIERPRSTEEEGMSAAE